MGKMWSLVTQYLKQGFVLGVINFLYTLAVAFFVILLAMTTNPISPMTWTATAIILAIPFYLLQWLINGWAMGWITKYIH